MKFLNFLRLLFKAKKVERPLYSIEELNSIKQYLQNIVNEFQDMNISLKRQSKDESMSDRQFKVTTAINAFIAIVTIGTLIFSIYSFNATLKEQQKIQAYIYWQGFLALTIQYPELANGMDCIDNVSIEYLAESSSYDKTPAGIKRHKEYIKYAWFVSNALNAAEIVYILQEEDPFWKSAIKEVLGVHRSFLNSVDFIAVS